MVEYALALALIVGVSLGAIDALTDGASDEVANQADCVSDRPPPPSCQIPAIVTSTTLTPPSSTPPPPPPPPPPTATAEFLDPIATGDPALGWAAHTTFSITADGSDEPLEGVLVRVRVRITSPPTGQSFFVSCRTGDDGRCTLDFDVPIAGATGVTFHFEDALLPDEIGSYEYPAPPDVSIAAPPPPLPVPP